MINLGTKISLSMMCVCFFLSFLHSPQKIFIFHKAVHKHIECEDIGANIFS
jgi:hypothetical protein